MCKLFIGQRSSKVLEIMSNDRCEKPLWLSVFCLFPQFTPLHMSVSDLADKTLNDDGRDNNTESRY